MSVDLREPISEDSGARGNEFSGKVKWAQRANWLPAPKGDFSLYVRAY